MPSPGAVWPAIVTSAFRTVSRERSLIVPETRKTMVRGPEAVTAARRLPGPASLRFVTAMTLPPRPPVAMAPYPSAPGKEGGCARAAAENKKATITDAIVAFEKDARPFRKVQVRP